MVEAARTLQWIVLRLTGIAPGGIHRSMVPPGAATPYIVVLHKSSIDIPGVAGHRLLTNSLYEIKVVGPGKLIATLVQIADTIDSILQRSSGATPDTNILACVREQTILSDMLVNGEQWSDVGGMYRIYSTSVG
jgi:hypothetical protein